MNNNNSIKKITKFTIIKNLENLYLHNNNNNNNNIRFQSEQFLHFFSHNYPHLFLSYFLQIININHDINDDDDDEEEEEEERREMIIFMSLLYIKNYIKNKNNWLIVHVVNKNKNEFMKKILFVNIINSVYNKKMKKIFSVIIENLLIVNEKENDKEEKGYEKYVIEYINMMMMVRGGGERGGMKDMNNWIKGLWVLLGLINKYKNKEYILMKEKINHINKIFLSKLLNIIGNIMKMKIRVIDDDRTIKKREMMMYLICKIIYNGLHYYERSIFPFMNILDFEKWMNLYIYLLIDKDQMNYTWKMKKYIIHTINRIFLIACGEGTTSQTFKISSGNDKQVNNVINNCASKDWNLDSIVNSRLFNLPVDDDPKLKLFLSVFNLKFLNIMLNYLQNYQKYPKNIICLSEIFVILSIKCNHQSIVPILLQNDRFLKVIMNLVILKKDSIESWNNDDNSFFEHELTSFDLKKFSLSYNDKEPRLLACFMIKLLISIGDNNNKMDVLGLIMKYFVLWLKDKNLQDNIKDGILYLLGNISDYYIKKDDVFKRIYPIEDVIKRFVFPYIINNNGFAFDLYLKARSLWVCGKYYSELLDNQLISLILKHIITVLLNENNQIHFMVFVKTQASITLLKMLKNPNEFTKSIIRKNLKEILQVLISILQFSNNESFVMNLELIIETFKVEITPYLINLTDSLVKTFFRFYNDDGYNSEKVLTCLKAISTICEISNVPKMKEELERYIIPMIQKLIITMNMHNSFDDYSEYVFTILKLLTRRRRRFSNNLWNIFNMILQIVPKLPVHYLMQHDDHIIVLNNFIVFDNIYFLSNENYIRSLLNCCEVILNNKEERISESICGIVKVISIILHNFRGKIDKYFERIISIIVNKIISKTILSNSLNMLICNCLSDCCFYNCFLTMKYLNTKNGLTHNILGFWFKSIKMFYRYYERKNSVIGLCSLLSFGLNNNNQTIRNNYFDIFSNSLKLIMTIFQNEKRREEIRKMKLKNKGKQSNLHNQGLFQYLILPLEMKKLDELKKMKHSIDNNNSNNTCTNNDININLKSKYYNDLYCLKKRISNLSFLNLKTNDDLCFYTLDEKYVFKFTCKQIYTLERTIFNIIYNKLNPIEKQFVQKIIN